MLCHINTNHKEIANKELKIKEEEYKKKAENEQNVFTKKVKLNQARCSIQSQQTLFETLERKNPGTLLTAHWLTNNFHQKLAVLRVCQLSVLHTAKNICDAIQSSMNEFLIPASKVHLVGRGNAANMVTGITEARYESLQCFLHTLQLVLNDAVCVQIYITNISAACKNIVTHFNHSTFF